MTKSLNPNATKSTYDDETTQDDTKNFFGDNNSTIKIDKERTKFMHKFLVNNIKIFIELFPKSVKLRFMSAFIYF